MRPFDYHEAKSVQEAVGLLASGEDIRLLAGGCGLLILMKKGLYRPRALINIKRIPGLQGLSAQNGEIRIGALCTHNQVRLSPLVLQTIPVLASALDCVATDRIRNLATIGGTLAHADPNSDVAPALLALNGRVNVVGKDGPREISLDSFFRDYFETALDPTETVTEIILPAPPGTACGVYARFQVRKAMDKAMPGVAVVLDLQEDRRTVKWARLALSGVGNTPIRLKGTEEFLIGKEDHPEVRLALASQVKGAIDPVADHHFSTGYRKEMAGVFLQRAFAEAYKHAASRRQ